MNKNLLVYAVVLLIFSFGIYFILAQGSRLELNRYDSGHSSTTVRLSSPHNRSETASSGLGNFLSENIRQPLSILLLQVIVIIITARLIGGLFLKIGQPMVIGEMVAGIILGPSLLGLALPKVMSFLFPAPSLGTLRLLSQIGVVLFMFIVGTELNARQLREKAQAAVMISHASIIAPFFLGVAVSLLIYRSFAPSNISFTSFALFLGVAMSITAFPVLARIIEERGLSNTYLGSTAIACAAVDDVTAWCVLALVIAFIKASGVGEAALTLLLALAFTAVMLFIIKPRLPRLLGAADGREKNGKRVVAGVLAFVFASACFTEVIGIHALFGAFLAGVVMPADDDFRSFLREKLATFCSAALLPLFFAFTGLRTQVGLINDWQSWLACVAIIAVAVAGKFGGGLLAARWAGMSWADSVSIGALMNTRGLMELVVLNIGYDLGILPERIFAIMVLMAIVTTCMTGPILSLVDAAERSGSAFDSAADTVSSTSNK